MQQCETVGRSAALLKSARGLCWTWALAEPHIQMQQCEAPAWGRSAIEERARPVLGFGFSFPVDHHTLDSGTLIQWTKGFENPEAVGEDPAKLLREAFRRQARPCRAVCTSC